MCETSEITVLFEDPFWITLIERRINGQYSVARSIIGTSEPSGANLADFFDHLNYDHIQFSVPVNGESRIIKDIPYKKRLRKNKKIQNNTKAHTYTKAHAMIKQLQMTQKSERKLATRAAKEELIQLQYAMQQQKKKDKHNGH
jgi:hypothetical protein